MAYVACNGKSVPQRIGDSRRLRGESGGSNSRDWSPLQGGRALKRIDDPSDFWMFQLVVEVARLDVSQEILQMTCEQDHHF